MSLFDLSGFALLVLYAICASLTVRWARESSRRREAARPLPPLVDPVKIAYLYGGEHEAARICTLGLFDRGLLMGDEQSVVAREGAATESPLQEAPLQPLELAILRKFEVPAAVETMYGDVGIRNACATIERLLREQGLLMNDAIAEFRSRARRFALLLLLAVSVAPIAVAALLGKHAFTIFLLVVVALGFMGYLAIRLGRTERTVIGTRALADLQRLLAPQRGKVLELRAGHDTEAAMLLAAVFGLAVLPKGTFDLVPKLFPHALDERTLRVSCSWSCSRICSSRCGSTGGCSSA